jgi:dolichyl-phosphate-mannose-protein mannosyltransferase
LRAAHAISAFWECSRNIEVQELPRGHPQPSTHGVDSARRSVWSGDIAILCYIALATVIAHVLTGGRYGFHRDELATLDDARHLSWGYIAYPPITPFFGRISLILFGTSLAGFRFFAALAEAGAVLLTGLIAREMGARRNAQLVAALAAIPYCLGGGAVMQYVSFDYFFWVLTAYFLVRLLKSEDPRWWIGIGCAIGLGMMSKYTMIFSASGIVVAVLATDARRFLKTKWLWWGVALSLLIFLPNLIWQVRHHFISLDFLKTIHARDIRIGFTNYFLLGQFTFTLLATPICVAGLYFCLFSKQGRRYRAIGWMYLVPFGIFMIVKARQYYLAPAYPMLYAAGSVWGQQWLAQLRITKTRAEKARVIRAATWAALAVNILAAAAVALPVEPIDSKWGRIAMKINGDYRDEIGWPELMQTLAQIRNTLPEAERARTGVLAANYGEAGAINLLGPQYGLPRVISGGNSFWAHGYGDPPPETVIVVGFSRQFVERNFASCQLTAKIWNEFGVVNEETRDHPDIFVCRGLKQNWPDFWRTFQYFG